MKARAVLDEGSNSGADPSDVSGRRVEPLACQSEADTKSRPVPVSPDMNRANCAVLPAVAEAICRAVSRGSLMSRMVESITAPAWRVCTSRSRCSL